MKTAQAETLDFGHPVVTLSRGQMGIVMVSGETEGLRQALLDQNFRYGPWILDGGPAWFMPRSLAGRHSDEVMKDAADAIRASGAILRLGRDNLKDEHAFSCSTRGPSVLPDTNPVGPELTGYDTILVQSSGGKDSLAMLSYVTQLADAAGVKDRILVLHENLGRVEWPGTAELVVQQAEHFGVRSKVLPTRPEGDLLTDIEFAQGDFPNFFNRFCTSEQKYAQAAKFMTKLVRSMHLGRRANVLNCIGLRGEESGRRREAEPLKTDAKLTSKRVKKVDRWLPIQGWTVEQVWAEIDKSGAPHHYAYDLGNERVSCQLCVFGSEADLLNGIENNPALAADYVALEQRIQRPLRSRQSVAGLAARVGMTQAQVNDRPVPSCPDHLIGITPRAQRPDLAAKIAKQEAGRPAPSLQLP